MIPTCIHFQQTNLQGGGVCKVGVANGQPAYRTCARCTRWEGSGQAEFKLWREKNRSSSLLAKKADKAFAEWHGQVRAVTSAGKGGCCGQ